MRVFRDGPQRSSSAGSPCDVSWFSPPETEQIRKCPENEGSQEGMVACDERFMVAVIFTTWFLTNLTINFYNKYGSHAHAARPSPMAH